MADKGGIQLLSESRKKIEVFVPGSNRILNFGFGVLVLSLVIWGGLRWYRSYLTNSLTALDGELLALEQQRDKKTEQALSIFQKQNVLISEMLKKHLYWTEGFAKIEALLSPQIQFETFSASAIQNTIDFKALAANYTAIAKQIAAFTSSASIEDVTLSNVANLTNGKLQFNMNIKFKPETFLSKNK